MQIQTTHRTIHFYDLFAVFSPAYVLDKEKYSSHFQAFLSKIRYLVKNKDVRRYQQFGEKLLFINELTIKPSAGRMIVQGKLLSIRKDFFPELLNTSTDITRDIEAKEEEGLVETTHFLIQQKTDNTGNKLKIAIEHNQFGAKITEFEYYLSRIGSELGILKNLRYATIVRNSLNKTKQRIGEVSKILIRINKDNIPRLKNINKNIWSVFDAAQDHFDEEYLLMEFKYDVRKARRNPTSDSATRPKSIVSKLISSLLKDKENVNAFERLEVTAEDSERYDRLNAFDLLIDKAKDDLVVQRRQKSRTIVSVDMFDKMTDSWRRNRIL